MSLPFTLTPDNPAPPGGDLCEVVTRDGVRLRAASWTAGDPTRGTVLILQGRAEFIEKYFEVIAELLERGYSVVAFDWRGQGGSDRALPHRYRGHVRHFSDFRLDVEAVLARYFPSGPQSALALAHSMGGCIALTGALQGWFPVAKLVALSPMIGLSLVRQPRLARVLAGILARLGLGTRLVPGGRAQSISTLPFAGNRLCTDERRYGRNSAIAAALDWGAIGSPTVGWLLAAYEAMDSLSAPDAASGIAVPTLIVASGDDPICSTPAIETFARDLTSGTIMTIPGARHEILMETDVLRAIFWNAFDAFVADETERVGVETLSA